MEKELGDFVSSIARMQYGTFRRKGFFIGHAARNDSLALAA